MSSDLDIIYQPRGRIAGIRGGPHASRSVGELGTFRDVAPFMAHPDARRIDLRATCRDPFDGAYVRRFHHRVSIDLYAVVDLTGSLAFQGRAAKNALVARLCASLARSATRSGDRFGLVGCNAAVREDCFIRATRRRGVVAEIEQALAGAAWHGADAGGLKQAARHLVGSRKMVFLISDFLMPLALVRDIFESLAQHDIVPVVIGDSSEDLALPDWGFLELADLETGERRMVFMRPKLKRLWLERENERRTALWDLARQFGRTPIRIADMVDVDQFSRDLLES